MTKRKPPKPEPWMPANPEEAQAAFDALQALTDDAVEFRTFLDDLERGMAAVADVPPKVGKPGPKRRIKR